MFEYPNGIIKNENMEQETKIEFSLRDTTDICANSVSIKVILVVSQSRFSGFLLADTLQGVYTTQRYRFFFLFLKTSLFETKR